MKGVMLSDPTCSYSIEADHSLSAETILGSKASRAGASLLRGRGTTVAVACVLGNLFLLFLLPPPGFFPLLEPTPWRPNEASPSLSSFELLIDEHVHLVAQFPGHDRSFHRITPHNAFNEGLGYSPRARLVLLQQGRHRLSTMHGNELWPP